MTATAVLSPPGSPPLRVERGGGPRLLAGPRLDLDAETLDEHRQRLGRRPIGGEWLLDVVERSGLRGRGGAWFPTHRKWRGVSRLALERGPSVVVVNASEGEPLARKDVLIAEKRPHLLIDGALIAAESVGADDVVIYLSRPARRATRALRHALGERRRDGIREPRIRIVHTQHRYVAGESSAVVRRVNGGQAKPTFSPPHPSERGVLGCPTLVQNAETIAHAALIARHGDAWFRERGTDAAPGTGMVTLAGNVARPGVYEVDLGRSLVSVVGAAGGVLSAPAGLLIGGYFGTWLDAEVGAAATLCPEDVSLGCGVIGMLGKDGCGVGESARIVSYLARESAGQCGPCVYGLRAVGEAMTRLAVGDADRGDLARIHRWSEQIVGRGACNHPDGAVNNLRTALETFAADVERHVSGHACAGLGATPLPSPPRSPFGWR
ncbi:MAG TPA: NADH-ubiquinone oxidoreductase-F iron-sulfur binding region domain-containing protein [Candidatus Saccharimonadales bacterium]|nr:NADH-ubiquinone oxidoreductase-F iron-sulfur binding region domain-containing protein [Candidatus Saccharimonadales bacterium]